MHTLLFVAQAFLVAVTAALVAAFVHALLADRSSDTTPSDLPADDQRARRAEHHHNQHVLHAQLAPGEQRGEGFEGGGMDVLHAPKSLFLAFFPSGK